MFSRLNRTTLRTLGAAALVASLAVTGTFAQSTCTLNQPGGDWWSDTTIKPVGGGLVRLNADVLNHVTGAVGSGYAWATPSSKLSMGFITAGFTHLYTPLGGPWSSVMANCSQNNVLYTVS